MAKDPAFLFYSDNFQSGTQFFTDEQLGKYIRLLCAQHLHGHLSEKQMMHICKTHDSEIWAKFRKDADGKFFNERLEDEIGKRKSYSESRAKNRKSITKSKKDKKNISTSYEKHMGDGIGNTNGSINRDAVEKFLVPEMFKKFKEHIPTYPGSVERDFKPLFSIAQFISQQGGLQGSPENNAEEIILIWGKASEIIAKDNFYRQKSLNTISNHIQEIVQIGINGKSNSKAATGGSVSVKSAFDKIDKYPGKS